MPLDLDGFFTGPEFLTALAQLISGLWTSIAVGFLGQFFGQTT